MKGIDRPGVLATARGQWRTAITDEKWLQHHLLCTYEARG